MEQRSKVFESFANIMNQKSLVKTSATKDKVSENDSKYFVVPEGSEKSGKDLIELAHPEQVQVAESDENDGIVENGLEQQKVMIDVALRMPKGVLAEVVSSLTKIANKLDEKQDAKSIAVANKIDQFLTKIAQEAPISTKSVKTDPNAWSQTARNTLDAAQAMPIGTVVGGALGAVLLGLTPVGGALGAVLLGLTPVGWGLVGAGGGVLIDWLFSDSATDSIYKAAEKAAKELNALDTEGQAEADKLEIIEQLKQFAQIKDESQATTQEEKIEALKQTSAVIEYVRNNSERVQELIQNSNDGNTWISWEKFSHDKEQAATAWKQLATNCNRYLAKTKKEINAYNASLKAQQAAQPSQLAQTAPAAPGGAASMAPQQQQSMQIAPQNPASSYTLYKGQVPPYSVEVVGMPEYNWDGYKWSPTGPPVGSQIVGRANTPMAGAFWNWGTNSWFVPTKQEATPNNGTVTYTDNKPAGKETATTTTNQSAGGTSAPAPRALPVRKIVKKLQKQIMDNGVSLAPYGDDGIFGSVTMGALKLLAKDNAQIADLIAKHSTNPNKWDDFTIEEAISALDMSPTNVREETSKGVPQPTNKPSSTTAVSDQVEESPAYNLAAQDPIKLLHKQFKASDGTPRFPDAQLVPGYDSKKPEHGVIYLGRDKMRNDEISGKMSVDALLALVFSTKGFGSLPKPQAQPESKPEMPAF